MTFIEICFQKNDVNENSVVTKNGNQDEDDKSVIAEQEVEPSIKKMTIFQTLFTSKKKMRQVYFAGKHT